MLLFEFAACKEHLYIRRENQGLFYWIEKKRSVQSALYDRRGSRNHYYGIANQRHCVLFTQQKRRSRNFYIVKPQTLQFIRIQGTISGIRERFSLSNLDRKTVVNIFIFVFGRDFISPTTVTSLTMTGATRKITGMTIWRYYKILLNYKWGGQMFWKYWQCFLWARHQKESQVIGHWLIVERCGLKFQQREEKMRHALHGKRGMCPFCSH